MKPYRNFSCLLSKTTLVFVILSTLILNSCSLAAEAPTATPTTTSPTLTPTAQTSPSAEAPSPLAVVTFDVVVPKLLSQDQSIAIDILDEVTGLGLNPTRYNLKANGSSHYSIQLPFTPGSVIKYRFVRNGKSAAVEFNAKGEQVRYRLFYVTGPSQIQDNIATWGDQAYTGKLGRISGTVLDANTSRPLANIMVTADGLAVLSNGDGSYLIDSIPPGIHNLVAFALDGTYQTFQQGADVQADLNTPAPVKLNPSHSVNITFNVSIPKDVAGVPVRMAGNILQLGNTFADLRGGTNTISSRMPVMSLQTDGNYSMTISLPAGLDLRYKYTLGDGFWNAEQTSDGNLNLRQLIVPEVDTVLNETVAAWKAGKPAPITFEVTVPANTPASDIISIQFNPFGWMEPLPMWSLGNNHWLYILYSPLNLLGKLSYRYCRNDQCGSADDFATLGKNPNGWPITVGLIPQTFKDDISQWAYWKPTEVPTTIPAAEIARRNNNFIAGIEFQPGYHPSWQPYILPVLQDFTKIGANWVIFSPSWTYSKESKLPDLSLTPGFNPLWSDLVISITQSRALGLDAAVFPQPVFADSPYQFWETAAKDNLWWHKWFEQYRTFILYHADLAAQTGASALIIGGDWLQPALPGGLLPDGKSSGVPTDSLARWQNLIAEVRNQYKGEIIWATPYPNSFANAADIISLVDKIYILISTPLTQAATYSTLEVETGVTNIIDQDILAIHEQFKKPIVIGLGYPSMVNAASMCVPDETEVCGFTSPLDQPSVQVIKTKVDLQAQVDIYNVFFAVLNQRAWIDGIISRGFYPPAKLQDSSRSINGKPAYDVVWYWFSRMVKP
jgi:hypothetical protein